MLNISFRSRVFSTDTLMDGEALIGGHEYDHMDEKQLQAELARLEDRSYTTVAITISHYSVLGTKS